MGAGLMALAAPAGAQAPPNPLSLLISHNLCQGWILDARTRRPWPLARYTLAVLRELTPCGHGPT